MTGDAIPPGHIVETVTSLEMFACPEPARYAPALPQGCRIERVIRPTVTFYRFLYDTVGEPWLWGGRRRWTDAALAEWVQDDRTEIWLLRTAIHRAWAGMPRRLWVHTCDLDHPAALGLYRREGFVPFRTHVEIAPDPRATGHIPPHVQPHRPIRT